MPRKHPESVKAAVQLLVAENPKATANEIRGIIAAGDFPGLEPYDKLGIRRTQQLMQEARRHLEPVPDDLDIGALTDEMERRSAVRIREEIARIHAQSTLSTEDQKKLRECHRTLTGIKENRSRRANPDRQKGKAAQDARPESVLARLAAEMAEAEPVSTGVSTQQTNGVNADNGSVTAEAETSSEHRHSVAHSRKQQAPVPA